MRAGRALGLVALALALAGCGARGGAEKGVLARVGSTRITSEMVEARLKLLPSFARAEYEGAEGRQKLLDRLIEEEMMYQAALDAGLANDKDVGAQIRDFRRRALVEAYYRRFVEKGAELSEPELQAYYQQHPEEFTEPAQARVRHILVKSQAEARRLRQEIVGGGKDFAAVARERSLDDRTKNDGGLIPGYVTKDRPVGSLGSVPEVVDAALALAPGKVSEPVKSARGWHLLRVEEQKPARLRPVEEVRDLIQSRGAGERVREKFKSDMAELRQRYKVKTFAAETPAAGAGPSAEELFRQAQETTDPRQRLQLYQQVVDNHPEDARAYEAQFMIGFVCSEDLKDLARAKTAFQAVLDKYPNCDLAPSARWMLDNLGKEAPEFEPTEDEPAGGASGAAPGGGM